MGITLKNNKSVTKNMTIKGDNGVGIKTITSGTPVVTEEKTTTPITVTLTDETTQNFNVEAKNGSGGGNALTKPTTAPSATQLVAVDNTNTQTMLNIGDGLSVENGSLKANGRTGGKKYMHYIRFCFDIPKGSVYLNTQFISTKADKFTKETLFNFLQDEYNEPGMEDNIYFIYSPVDIPKDVNIANLFFSRNNDVSLSEIGIWWYETGNVDSQAEYFTKDSENLLLYQEHIIEL